MGFYPVVLELRERPVLVVGGGPVAERKVEGLLEARARVKVVSPSLTERLQTWAREGRVHWISDSYRRGDFAGQTLVFVAIGDGVVNTEVVGEARARGIWVNTADAPQHCDFILPSVLRRGELTVAVSTGGTCPALSRMLREQLEAYFTDEYTALAHVASEARRELREGKTLARLLERLQATACLE